jgi:DNA-binding NtrC family response regulator
MNAGRILVVDDDALSLKLLEKALEIEGYEVVTAQSGAEALERLAGHIFDAALIDVMMPGMNGLELLREIHRRDPSIEVVMTTAYPDVATAVDALKQGATDYLQKPLNLEELRHRLTRVIERRFLRGEVGVLRTRLGERLVVKDMIGVSPAMAELKQMILRVAAGPSAVLIEGESGTGKELVAGAIHHSSPRGAFPFIPVNCGAIPSELLESEFFGHVRGAFTGAHADTLGLFRSADKGTLFLDEIGELPASLQSKLLRVLENKEVRPVGSTKTFTVDVRVVAATNRNLEAAVEQGSFRRDLFYRLNVVSLTIPPLRERRDDIQVLATYFIRQFNHRFGREVRTLSPAALALLCEHDFPGNVRELENLIERAYALGATRELIAADFASLSKRQASIARDAARQNGGDDALLTLADMERELICKALARYPNDRAQAAHALGLSQRTLFRRLKEYGLH